MKKASNLAQIRKDICSFIRELEPRWDLTLIPYLWVFPFSHFYFFFQVYENYITSVRNESTQNMEPKHYYQIFFGFNAISY